MESISFQIWGLVGAVAVFAVLELVKRVWVGPDGETIIKDRWAVVASVVIGLLLSVASYFAARDAIVADIVEIIGAGILAGLAACGVFSATKSRE